MRHRIRTLRRDDGQAVVELALAIPLLLLVLFAIIQFGQGIAYYNDETNLANLAARYASVNVTPSCTGAGSSNITDYVRCQGAKEATLLGSSSVTTCVADTGQSGSTVATVAQGDPIQVKVSVPYPLANNLPILGNFLGSLATITISSSATLRAESAITTTTSSFTPTVTTSCP